MRSERDFCTELKRSTPTIQPCFWWKIVDAGFRNWFDIVCCCQGKFFAFEAKISKQKNQINFYNLFRNRSHEIEALLKVEKSGGHAFVLVNVFDPGRHNYMAFFRAHDVDGWMKANKGVLPLDSIVEPEKIYKNKEGLWDLTRLINA